MFHTDNSFKESLIVSTKLNCDILNIKIRQKYYTTYIIHNVICRPHWLKLFSNWSKYNAKPSLNTKWRQISMGWFNFFEQTFPRICLNKFLIVSVQLFILSKPDNRYINLQQSPKLFYHSTYFEWREIWGVTSQNGMTFFCMLGWSRGWPMLVLYWSTNDFLFYFTIIYWPALTF